MGPLSSYNPIKSFDMPQGKESKETPLHQAIKNKELDKVKNLLSHTEWFNAQDDEGNTPLHLALASDLPEEICLEIIEKGADLSLKNKVEVPPFIRAIANNKLQAAEKILESQPGDISATYKDGNTVWHYAARANIETMGFLKRHGALPLINRQNDAKLNALGVAVVRAKFDICEWLISNQATISPSTPWILFGNLRNFPEFSDEKNWIKALQFLSKGGVNLNIQNEQGDFLIHCVVKSILEVLRQNPYQTTFGSEVLNFLFKNGADFGVVDRLGTTPLMLGINEQPFQDMMGNLDFSFQDQTGNTLLHYLLNAKNPFDLVSESKKSPEAYPAFKSYQEAIVKKGLAKGANVNSQNKEGITPLHLAALSHNSTLVKTLLMVHANPLSKDKNGFPPIYGALAAVKKKIDAATGFDDLDTPDYYEALDIVRLLPLDAESIMKPEMRQLCFSTYSHLREKRLLELLLNDPSIFLSLSSEEKKKLLNPGFSELATLVQSLIEKTDPFTGDPCLLRLYVDNCLKFPDWVFLSSFINAPITAFDGMTLLTYLEKQAPLNIGEKMRFVSQVIGHVGNEEMGYAREGDPSSQVKLSGNTPKVLYPLLARYAEMFLKSPEIKMSLQEKENLLKYYIKGAEEHLVTPQKVMRSFEQEEIENIYSGYDIHYIPIFYLKIQGVAFQAILNRGGERRKEASLVMHKINPVKLNENVIEERRKNRMMIGGQSAQQIYDRSLQDLEATGHDPIADLFIQVIGSKKSQKGYNCALVGSTSAFELGMAFERVRKKEISEFEELLKDTNVLYKWFTLFIAVQAMTEIYEMAEVPVDRAFEEKIYLNITQKFEKLQQQLGTELEVIKQSYSSFQIAADEYWKKFSLSKPSIDSQAEISKAIKIGDLQKLDQVLLQEGMEFKNAAGCTPLVQALQAEKEEVALHLIEKGANLHATGGQFNTNTLSLATFRNLQRVVDVILSKEPTLINLANKRGMTPLIYALMRGNFEIVDKLLKNGASIPNGKRKDIAIQFMIDGSIEGLKKGLDLGMNPNPADEDAVNDLFMSLLALERNIFNIKEGVFSNSPIIERLEILFQKGLNANTQDEWGNTLLMRVLGAEPDIKAGRVIPTPFDPKDYSDQSFESLVKLMIAHKADINLPNCEGITPLHQAIFLNKPELVKILLNNGADASIKDNADKTALDWCELFPGSNPIIKQHL